MGALGAGLFAKPTLAIITAIMAIVNICIVLFISSLLFLRLLAVKVVYTIFLQIATRKKPADNPPPSNQPPFDQSAFGLKDFRDSPPAKSKLRIRRP